MPKKKSKPKAKTTTPKPEKLYRVIAQGWEESERGWGTRSDGYTLYTTIERYNNHIKEDEERKMKTSEVPDCYTRTIGPPDTNYFVGKKTYEAIKMAESSGPSGRYWGDGKTVPVTGTLP